MDDCIPINLDISVDIEICSLLLLLLLMFMFVVYVGFLCKFFYPVCCMLKISAVYDNISLQHVY